MQHVAGQLKKYYNNNLPHFGGSNDSSDPQVTPSVQRRNARERNRVKQVNNGFVNLRQHLPQTVINTLSHGGRGASKKLSKVDTLRIAVEYIRGLQDMLEGQESTRRLFTTSGGGGGNSSSDESSSNSSYQDQDQDYTHYQAPHSYHSASPTPSYSDSDLSGSYVKQEQEEEQQQLPLQQQFKFESFDSFSDEQPDDEELLDYISSWQEHENKSQHL
ncbi:l-1-sc [Drosophila busckii]|uniref:L-1-sc n=1 Tax=Drosophila busckii TaxID=30019 RepID=A0A0M4F923_DROBS|nr:l-1-sc [Drosophila busckii]